MHPQPDSIIGQIVAMCFIVYIFTAVVSGFRWPEKYTKKKQFKQISEGNPTPAVQKKLIKIFQNDPLYKDVIMATNSKQMQKALGTLRSIRGPNAIKLLKKHSKKLMGKDY